MTNQTQHGLFHMENAGGYKPAEPTTAPSRAADEHQPSCFGWRRKRVNAGRAVAVRSRPLMRRGRACDRIPVYVRYWHLADIG